MAKKKKKSKARSGADSRGYTTVVKTAKSSERVGGSAARQVEVTSKAHEGLTNLLGELTTSPQASAVKDIKTVIHQDDEDGVPKGQSDESTVAKIPASWRNDETLSAHAIDPTSSRFLKKVTNLHDKLAELGFTEKQIECVMQAMSSRGAKFNLETALDWLCLNMPSEQLPSLFAEATIRISALGGEGEISVVKSGRSSSVVPGGIHGNSANALSDLMAEMALKKGEPPGDESPNVGDSALEDTNESDRANRAWLLEQYQYVEESDNESLNEMAEVERDEKDEDEDRCEMTPEERRLTDLEKQIKEDAASLNDDAANYMRSKREIAELKKRLKKAEAQARGLRAKVAKFQSAKAKENPEENEAKAETEGINTDGGGDNLFSLFDVEDDVGESVTLSDTPSLTAKVSAECSTKDTNPASSKKDTPSLKKKIASSEPSIPKGWTGKTPKKILEEWCQKRKLPKPQFQKLPRTTHGCRIVVQRQQKQPQTKKGKAPVTPEKALTIEQEGPFHSFTDAQHFLSTEALYELNPTIPLYRLFPLVFRDLWKSWLDEVEAKKEAAIKSKQEKKDEKMKNLVQSIFSDGKREGSAMDGSDLSKGTQPAQSKVEAPEVPDSWDDISADGESDNEKSVPPAPQQLSDNPSDLGNMLRDEYLSRQKLRRYTEMVKERKLLPMQSYREKLLDSVQKNRVTVLCAQTGAGKTTQCPQFLLEDAILSGFGDRVSIICTQPRRISAISVAERVADEMCENIGDSVGYHIRGQTRRSKKTKLMFCTTGVVLRRLQDDPDLAGVTHIVVDEVHERQWQIDFLLIVVRQLIRTRRKDLKVILMSATLDSQLFCSFFHGAPFLSVPGRTFPVAEYYLEDLLDATDHIIEEGSRCALRVERDCDNYSSLWVTGRGGEKRKEIVSLESEARAAEVSDDYAGYKLSTRRSMERVDEEIINYDLIEDILILLLIEPQDRQLSLPVSGGATAFLGNAAVLVFLPGLGEIRALSERLKGSYKFGNRQKFDIIPMHSTLSPKDQRRAFLKPKSGCRKIILATNICETSITIPDVAYVIDSGLVREVRTNKRTGTSTLVTDWCSKASAKQRSGRAGRVRAGICCKLYSSRTATRVMKDQAMPELQRVPLEEVCLSILAGKMSFNCMDFLLQAPQPPAEEAVQKALALLAEVGAIQEPLLTSPAKTERLTPLGGHLAKLPVHVRLGKMLIFGALFRCLDKVLTVAASLSCSKSAFATSVDDAQQAAAHRTFVHPTSDFLTICNMWDAYSMASAESASNGRKFCDKFFLNRAALVEISDLRRQFLSLLDQIGFVSDCCCMDDFEEGNCKNLDLGEYNKNGNMESIVSAVICAGLYPNIAHAIKTSAGGIPELWHRTERLHFHSSSVNHKKTELDSEWVTFYEKFATRRVYISATSLVKPFSLLLFGRSVVVKHLERKAIVDDWIELNAAAQTGVMFRELRHEVDLLLKDMIENVDDKHEKGYRMINGIVQLLASE